MFDTPSNITLPSLLVQLVAPAFFLAIVLELFNKRTKQISSSSSSYVSPPYATTSLIHGIKVVASMSGVPFPIALLNFSRKFQGGNFRIHGPMRQMLFCSNDIEVCKQVLHDRKAKKTTFYKGFRLIHNGGDDIFTSDGLFWEHSRKGLAPAFSSKHIRRMSEVGIQQTNEFVQSKLSVLANSGDSFDLCEELVGLTISIICEAAFEYYISKEEIQHVVGEFQIALLEVQKSKIPFRRHLGFFIPAVRRARRAGKNVLTVAYKILDSYRKLQNPTKGTVIDCIVNNPNYNNDKERASDIVILLFAGYDTTAYSLGWTLIELAKRSKEQQKLRDALKKKSVEDRSKSLELNCVIKEGMRLNPTAAVASGRISTKDITIKGKNPGDKDVFVPKGSFVLYCPMVIFRNETIFDRADEFQPSRWIDPSEEMLSSFHPFSLGRRNCVGQSLANTEIREVLARLCTDFHFTLDEEGSQQYFGTWRPKGYRFTVKKV